MTDKRTVIELIERMPDNVSLSEIIEEVATVEAVRCGLKAADEGRVVPHEVVKRSFAKWISN